MRLYGKRSVSERLKINPRSVKGVFFEEGVVRPEPLALARRQGIPVQTLGHKRFLQLAQGNQAQGVMAEVEKFVYSEYEEIIGEQQSRRTLIFLDRVSDPHNLGVILRSCACFGGFAVVLPAHESAEVNETVLKVACGAENYIPVSREPNLAVVIQKAKKAGYWIAATVVEGGESLRQAAVNFPLGLVFGSEGEGIRAGLLKYVDYRFTLPMAGADLSFNVAIAASIFCYELAMLRPDHEKE